MKRRIIGASVLVALLVIFVPMLIEHPKAPATTPPEGPAGAAPKPVASPRAQNEPVRSAPEITPDIPLPPMVENPPAVSSRAPSVPQLPPPVKHGDNAGRDVPRPIKPAFVRPPPPRPEAPMARPEPEPRRMAEAPRPQVPPPSPRNLALAAPTLPARPPREHLGAPAGGNWVVQLGAFSHRPAAMEVAGRLRQRGYPAFVQDLVKDGKRLFRVRVGPQADRQASDALRRRLEQETRLEAIVARYP